MIILFLVFLLACEKEQYMIDELVPEVVCTHPNSIYEAQVYVEYPDNENIESVEFILEQEGEFWTTWMWPPDEFNVQWRTKMQIIEFDCSKKYFYDFSEITI